MSGACERSIAWLGAAAAGACAGAVEWALASRLALPAWSEARAALLAAAVGAAVGAVAGAGVSLRPAWRRLAVPAALAVYLGLAAFLRASPLVGLVEAAAVAAGVLLVLRAVAAFAPAPFAAPRWIGVAAWTFGGLAAALLVRGGAGLALPSGVLTAAALGAGGVGAVVSAPAIGAGGLAAGAAALGMIALGPPALTPVAAPAPGTPAVLLVTLDTTRADRLGAYGYAGARTPHLDALAADGVRFETAVSLSRFTGPSHASILTGVAPEHSGVVENGEPLPKPFATLADRLRPQGFVSGAFVSGWTVTDAMSGLPGRFDERGDDLHGPAALPAELGRVSVFRHLAGLPGLVRFHHAPVRRSARRVTDAAVDWLARNGGRPWLLWVHYFDPHLPYHPPERFLAPEARTYSGPVDGGWYDLDDEERAELVQDPAAVAQMRHLYDALLASTDTEVGRLLESARRAAPDGRLLVAVTADHGESMGEHGRWWSRDLYEPTLRVPLLMAGAGLENARGRVVYEPVRTVDLAPTLIDLLDLPVPADLDGRSLRSRIEGREDDGLPAYVEMHPAPAEREAWALRDDRYKVIHRHAGFRGWWWAPESVEIYDLARDPAETRDLAADPPPPARALVERLESHEESANGASPVDRALDADDRARLEALGYVQ